MFKPVEISDDQIKKNFQALPLQLRRKILPKKHLTLEEQIKKRVRESEMTASIV